MSYKSGFVALIGRPNVGKSTLLNSIIKQKVAIISPKAQTTRNVIRGVFHSESMQIVFLDTPGIHRAQNELGKYMNRSARASYHDVEAVLLITDGTKETPEELEGLVSDIQKSEVPLILVLNKIDLLEKKEIMRLVAAWSEKYKLQAIIPVSAMKSDNLESLLKVLEEILPEGPKYYPDDMITDNPESFLIGELIREKILYFTKEEIPHSVAVVIEKMNQTTKALNLYATIIVERDSQKGIIIGKGGTMIKKIGTAARQEIERIFATKVRLETFVRVEKDWRNNSKYLKEFGYRE